MTQNDRLRMIRKLIAEWCQETYANRHLITGSKAQSRRAKFVEPSGIEHLPATLSVMQLAELLQVSRQHVWNMVKRGEIRTTAPLGRIIRIPRPEAIRLYGGREP